MSHEVEILENGQFSMFYVAKGGVPWHNGGHSVSEAPTWEEGIKLAHLDWTVSLHDMYSNVNGQRIKAINRMVVRDSDNKYLSEVGPRWHPLQNVDAFYWKLQEGGLGETRAVRVRDDCFCVFNATPIEGRGTSDGAAHSFLSFR